MRISLSSAFILAALVGFGPMALSNPVREVKVEWDSVQDAVSYDVEVSKANDHTVVFKLEEVRAAKCNLSLEPGSYLVRVRSRDERGLLGSWGDPQIIEVPEFPIFLKAPWAVDDSYELFQHKFAVKIVSALLSTDY